MSIKRDPTEYQSVVEKLYKMGLRQTEIALILDISQPTVSKLLNGYYKDDED